jgi:hypothetical protein
MSLDRIQKLHALGLGNDAATTALETTVWDAPAVAVEVDDPHTVEAEEQRPAKSSDRLWDQRFEELKAFKQSYGT